MDAIKCRAWGEIQAEGVDPGTFEDTEYLATIEQGDIGISGPMLPVSGIGKVNNHGCFFDPMV
ncbi:MAG: hypothetical protein IPP83_00050 [Flavobacteriales bacterium]|nr:hypothetical protein [Flavobacteriales bacterium]